MGSPINLPDVNVQLIAADAVNAFGTRRNIIFGQKLASGTAGDKELVQNVHTMTLTQIAGLFGTGELYWRIVAWRNGVAINAVRVVQPLDVIGANPNSLGATPTAVVSIAGTATAAGTIRISIVDELLFTVDVAVANAFTPTNTADAIVTAINALQNAPFTASNSAGVVTISARDAGTIGNFYGLRVNANLTGQTASVTNWSGGANDPTLTDILDPIDGVRYTGASWPENWQSSLNIISTEFDTRFNSSAGIMDGVVFHGRSDTFANLLALGQSNNSQSLVIMGNNRLASGPAILQPADWAATYFMGVRDLRLTPNAGLGHAVITRRGPQDRFGGPHMASLPYFNTPLANTPLTSPTNLFSTIEQRQLNDAGIATFGPNPAGNTMILGAVVTTNTTDAAGNPSNSFHFLNYVDTGTVSREIFQNTLRAAFAQTRLTEGDLLSGYSMENENSIRLQCAEINRFLAENALTERSLTNDQAFANNLTVTINKANRSVDIFGPIVIVTQLERISYGLQLAFTADTANSGLTEINI